MNLPADPMTFDFPEERSGSVPQNLLRVAWERKSLVLLGLVVGLGIAGLYAVQRKPQYLSTAQVLIVKKSTEKLAAGGGISDDYVPAQVAIIKSQMLLDRAVKAGKLHELPSFEGVSNPTPLIKAGLQVTRESKEGAAQTDTSQILNLTYQGPEPEECSAVLYAIIRAYKDFLDETYKDVSAEQVINLNKMQDDLGKQLNEKVKAHKEFLKKRDVPVLGKDQVPVAYSSLADLQAKRNEVVVKLNEAERRLRALRESPDGGNIVEAMLASKPGGPDREAKARRQAEFRAQMTPLVVLEEALLKTVGEDHPRVKDVRQKIETLRKVQTAFEEDVVPAVDPAERQRHLRAAVVESEKTRDELRISLASHDELIRQREKDVKDLNQFEYEDQDLRREISRVQQMFDDNQKKLAQINLISGMGGYDTEKLADPAPGARVGVTPVHMLIAGAVLGLLLGLGLASLADLADRSFRSPEEIRRRLGLPVIGHVPAFLPDKRNVPLLTNGGPALDRFLCSYYQPKALVSESFRGIRTALYFSTEGEEHKVIQVTSPNMGDGKSTLVANLAVSIAQSGKSVLLVDADCRRPRQHKLFGLAAKVGLVSVLEGEADVAQAVSPTPVPNLSLLPCGPIPPNPAELLTSPRFKELLDSLRGQYDFVLVDTPPLLAVSDPAIVAPRVDAVILTIRLGKNGRPSAERAREVLASLGANLIGVVVNGIGAGDASRYGRYQYGYGYGYGYGYTSAYADPYQADAVRVDSTPDLDLGALSPPAAGNGTGDHETTLPAPVANGARPRKRVADAERRRRPGRSSWGRLKDWFGRVMG